MKAHINTNKATRTKKISKSGVFVIALLIANLFLTNKGLSQSQTFSTPGTFNFTAPTGVTSVTVESWGGGGKGGSTTSQNHTGGGGGGAYSKKNTIVVTPGNNYTVVVGAGATTTSAGGDSYFIDISTILAKGGNSVANNSANGVAGGAATSGIGDTKFSGGNGANGVTGQGGGGGSSAGTAANGVNGTGGTGGTAPAGGGNGSSGASTGNTPQAGGLPGGGGGGTSSTGSSTGGNGAAGKIIISWCVTPTTYSVTGGGNYCVGGAGVTIGLSNSQTGVNYQLYNGASTVGSPVAGITNSPINFGSLTSAGIYTVVATNTNGGCTSNMTGNATVTINPIPVVSATSANITCNGASNGIITVTATGGTSAYMFSVNDGADYFPATIGDTREFDGLAPNTPYRIKVKDANECESK